MHHKHLKRYMYNYHQELQIYNPKHKEYSDYTVLMYCPPVKSLFGILFIKFSKSAYVGIFPVWNKSLICAIVIVIIVKVWHILIKL